ncbi:MAG TPA: NAD(P)/FAD-dependent oxidoreductase, partial [Devosia sp.]|nr:NAD(P)/FAD-dependent oxidoreductase [Devosia sp.]
MRVAVIGSGVCGIAAAKTLKQLGHEVTVFERSDKPGGVWSVAYAGVQLQNHRELYAYSDFPWPFDPGPFPAAADIRRYIDAAIAHYGFTIRFRHEVTALEQQPTGWRVKVATPAGPETVDVDAVVIAAGHYTHEKAEIALPGRERFGGRILTEHDVTGPDTLAGERVAIVGIGKSAVDMASFAVGHAREIHHIFREARWMMPRRMMGQLTSRLATERLSGFFGRSWVYPHRLQQLTQRHNPRSADINEAIVSNMVRRAHGIRGRRVDAAARKRLAQLDPSYPMSRQFRGTLAPDNYFPAVIRGDIEPHRSALNGLTETGVILADGTEIPVDT